ncbi:MAG: hypothetical protein ACREJ5_27455 [Geminicoccaceae bacterium]
MIARRTGISWVRFAAPSGALLLVALGHAPGRAEQLWFLPELPVTKVEEVMRLARDNLHLAVLPDGSHVPRETPEEQARPLISEDLARRVVDVGIVSAMAKWCGVEWFDSNYRRFMSTERASGRPPKVMAYLGLMHGTTMNLMDSDDGAACTERQRGHIATFIAARWPE